MPNADDTMTREAEQERMQSIDRAVNVGIRNALMGFTPIVLLVGSATYEKYLERIVLTVWILILGLLYAILVGISCGCLAHATTSNTSVSTNMMSKIMTWVVNVSLWSWIFVAALDRDR